MSAMCLLCITRADHAAPSLLLTHFQTHIHYIELHVHTHRHFVLFHCIQAAIGYNDPEGKM